MLAGILYFYVKGSLSDAGFFFNDTELTRFFMASAATICLVFGVLAVMCDEGLLLSDDSIEIQIFPRISLGRDGVFEARSVPTMQRQMLSMKKFLLDFGIYSPLLFLVITYATPGCSSSLSYYCDIFVEESLVVNQAVCLAHSIGMLLGLAMFQLVLFRVPYRTIATGVIFWWAMMCGLRMATFCGGFNFNDTLWPTIIQSLIASFVQQTVLLFTLVLWVRACPQGLEAGLSSLLLTIPYAAPLLQNCLHSSALLGQTELLALQVVFIALSYMAIVQFILTDTSSIKVDSLFHYGVCDVSDDVESTTNLLQSKVYGTISAKERNGTPTSHLSKSIEASDKQFDEACRTSQEPHWIMVENDCRYSAFGQYGETRWRIDNHQPDWRGIVF